MASSPRSRPSATRAATSSPGRSGASRWGTSTPGSSRPHQGESFVICSDGLSNELTRDEIEAVLAAAPDAEAAATELVRRAVEAGGRDNVTAIVVQALR